MAKILIVDDERSIRNTLKEILEYEKYKVDEAADGMEGLVMIKRGNYDLVILDIKMPKLDGIEALDRILEIKPDLPVLMISGHANIDTAVSAVKKGAYDFIEKPPDLNRLLVAIKNGLERPAPQPKPAAVPGKTKTAAPADFTMVGESEQMLHIKRLIEKIAPSSARILITGENGTGKELVARSIHQRSSRADHPLIEVNCAAIPSELIESELFGHEKGAFTSAMKQHIGKFEQANGGTLFLDEIGDMSLSAQAKVLRALQENIISRVGGDKKIKVDVRVLAATNKDLKKEINEGRFREDLYHRLAVIPIHVPSLSERKADIPLIANYFLERVCKTQGVAKKSFDKGAIELLQKHAWTGNIRELRNVVERLVIMCNERISKEDILQYVRPVTPSRAKAKKLMDKFNSAQEFKDFMNRAFEQIEIDFNPDAV